MRTLSYNITDYYVLIETFFEISYKAPCKTHTVIVYQSDLCTGYVINEWD